MWTMGEALDLRRKRLLYLSWRRGMRETDLLLGRFADRHLSTLGEDQLGRYEKLLEVEDGLLLDWVTRRLSPGAEHDSDVLRLLIEFHHRQ
jgi:antitoxin CptB